MFQKFVNFFFIVMTINEKSIWYFLSFVVHLFMQRLRNFLKQWSSCRRGFPFAFNNRFFQVFQCGNCITFQYFFTCPMDTYMSPDSKWNSHMSAIFKLNLSFLRLRRNLDILWSHSFLLFGFLKMKKSNACFSLGLVNYFGLRAFAVRYIAIIATATTMSFFRSFSRFGWTSCCW